MICKGPKKSRAICFEILARADHPTNRRGLASGMADRQVRRSYREALVQISPTTDKKRKKETGGHWREW